jgi:hypothetical protein
VSHRVTHKALPCKQRSPKLSACRRHLVPRMAICNVYGRVQCVYSRYSWRFYCHVYNLGDGVCVQLCNALLQAYNIARQVSIIRTVSTSLSGPCSDTLMSDALKPGTSACSVSSCAMQRAACHECRVKKVVLHARWSPAPWRAASAAATGDGQAWGYSAGSYACCKRALASNPTPSLQL